MGTSVDDAVIEIDPAGLHARWSERVASDAGLDGGARELLAHEGEALDAVLELAVTRFGTHGEEGGELASRAALAAGRAAFAHDVDLAALQRLFGHLHDVMTERLLDGAADADGHLCTKRAGRAARRVRRAMERPVLEATRGWFDEAGRKLRHDVKTPLQATSLNLELLTLESAERGIDTEALDTIQRSLDQVVELLARAEPAEG